MAREEWRVGGAHECIPEGRRVNCVDADGISLEWARKNAGDWRRQPIKFVIGIPPDCGNDIAARAYGHKLQESLKQPVVIENKLGSAGFIAAELMARAAPIAFAR